MHLLLIHQAFASPADPGGTRHYEFARLLTRKGHACTVVVSQVNYQTGCRRVSGLRLITKEHQEGVGILRVYAFPTLHRSFVWRIVSFLSFTVMSALAGLRVPRIDVVMGTSPPIFQAFSAWLVAAVKRRPFLLEVRDLWPEFAMGMGVLRNPILIRLSRRFELFLYRRATHIIVNSPAYKDYLIGRGVPHDKISEIYNGVDPSLFRVDDRGESFRKRLSLNDEVLVTYSGALGVANDIPCLLRAAQRLNDEHAIKFAIVGNGKERPRLETMARELGLRNLTFFGARPKAEMPAILAASDICLGTLQDIPMFRMTYPNKVFDYMAAGRPTVLAIDGVIREVIDKSGGGVFVPPGDDVAMAGAIRRLATDPLGRAEMGRLAQSYVEKHFNRHHQAAHFMEVCERLHSRKEEAQKPGSIYQKIGKRCVDIVAAGMGLIVLSPAIAILAFLVRVKLGSPVLYRTIRPGLHGKLFELVKFRTMTDARDSDGRLLPDDQRLSPPGGALRLLSLDELPELVNVLKGDMSLVGPRPLLVQYLDRYTPEQMRRHQVLPGITGWAQANGRNALSWEERFAMDVWYVDNQSFWLDMKILAMTMWKIVKREGINQPGHATREEFKGSQTHSDARVSS